MRCREVDYEIIDHDMQMVVAVPDPNEIVVVEAGAMKPLKDNL